MQMLISPAERPPITSLGSVSSLPEKFGSDILFHSPNGLVGVQRKTITDLVASVRDNRLGRELQQLQQVPQRYLILEGSASWTPDGNLFSQHIQWTLRQQWGVESSIQSSGVSILRSRSATETCSLCEWLYERMQQEPHVSSLLARGSAPKNGWGKRTDEAYAVHFLSGIEGVSVVLAKRIYEAFGCLPLKWDCTREQLEAIEGLGRVKVDAIWRVLE